MTRAISVLSLALGALVACQPGDKPGPEYIEDMARGQSYKAFAPNEATRNGITLQRPVAGTIARGYQTFHFVKTDADATRAGLELSNPFHPTPQVLEKGKSLYQIYCAVCHGAAGKGDGPISTKIPPPPSYKSDRLLQFPPGRFFHVITMGANKMPSYAVQIVPAERWLIITYIRAELQGLPEATPGSLPAEPLALPGPIPVATLGLSTPSAPPPAAGSGGSK
jgi:mono/diheme cytochrome c family protein